MQFDGPGSATYSIHGHAFEIGKVAGDGTRFGIGMTSAAFETVHDGFRYVLFAGVFLFAFSTLITWSDHGLQAWHISSASRRAPASPIRRSSA